MKKGPTAGGPWGFVVSGEMGDTPDENYLGRLRAISRTISSAQAVSRAQTTTAHFP